LNLKKTHYCVSVIFFLLCNAVTVKAQNLFANPGFEDINTCTENNAECAPEAWFNIPATNFLVNVRAAPKPFLGHMVLVIPMGNVMDNFNKPRYVYTGLCCPLVAGQQYNLSFYINTGSTDFRQLAFYFTEKEPRTSAISNLIKTPSVIITKENFDAELKQNWKHVQCSYTATGKEKFCTITTDGLPVIKYTIKDVMNNSGDVLCFIDEIKLQSQNPVAPCAEYADNIKIMYDYNYRHHNDIPVFNEIIEVPKPKPAVSFKSDTLVIGDLLFDVGKYNLKPGLVKILDSLVAKLENTKFLNIVITGHTDNTGNEKNNQTLSETRAVTIKDYLVQKIPNAADKISATGKGQNFPIAENTTAAGKQKNRRVEIVITYLNIIK